MKDDWRQINLLDLIGDYSINSEGNVRNNKFNRILINSKNTKGYEYVQLPFKNGRYKNLLISRLLALAFIDGFNYYDKSSIVHHKDSINKTNNIEQILVCTQRDNINFAFAEGNRKIGEEHHNAVFSNELSEKIVDLIKQNLTTTQIIKALNLENKKNLRTFINDLRAKRTRLYLTNGIENKKIIQNKFDINMIKDIICYLKQGLSGKDIIDKIGKGHLSRTEKHKYYRLMHDIKSGKSWKNLYKDESSTTIEKYVIKINI